MLLAQQMQLVQALKAVAHVKLVIIVAIVQKTVEAVGFVNKFKIMKKLLLLTTLLIAIFARAQDYATIEQLKSTDFESSLKLANDMKSMAKINYHLYKYKEFEKEGFLKVVYAPEGVTDEQLETSKDFSKCLMVFFKIYFEGKNADLEKPGIKKYKFTMAQGKYLDLFPVWQSWFVPGADLEKTSLKSFNEFSENDKNILFYFQKRGNEWTIRNDS